MAAQSPIPYRAILLLLCAIFAARVFIQFGLQFTSVSFLPVFNLWHSEAMPYLVLFSAQVALLTSMIYGAITSKNRVIRPKLGQLFCVLGFIYLFAMLSRLAIGITESSDKLWFEGAVPTAIHFILIAYVFVFGANLQGYRADGPGKTSALLGAFGYPLVLLTSYLLFIWMLQIGTPLMFSAYLAVLVGATIIIVHETFAPHRKDWRPELEDLISDGLFLVFVQVALPAMMKAGALALIIWLSLNNVDFMLHSLWPHNMPIILQVILMLCVAEFFRYWIHRASHRFIPLWKLHAVHHASDKLYTINVGRFHPFDKAIQFLGDTLPFVLFGVKPEVFAAYFVLYALNGFYQHSNANVKLGVFNWIIAGPELHRWHHSASYKEANANFGNNLIIWDSLFGTRYLPEAKTVGRVGIGNPNWPSGFFAQLLAPFNTSTNATTFNEKLPVKGGDAD